MGAFFCAHSLQVIDFWHKAKWNIADSSSVNFYKITEKSNKKLLKDIYYRQLRWKIGIFLMHVKSKKNLPIWKCFFAFIVCRENTYISRLLAMIFIHKTESIIFIRNFIIKTIKIAYFYRMWCYAKSIVSEGLSAQKKAPIWECFFAFTVCRENTYISRLLAIIFIHQAELIIFITKFIIKISKTVHFHHV